MKAPEPTVPAQKAPLDQESWQTLRKVPTASPKALACQL